MASMVVSFLGGQQTPTVESTDADFDTLGVVFRGYHDFGVDQAEYLAGIKSVRARRNSLEPVRMNRPAVA